MTEPASIATNEIPPIVLLIEEDVETLEQYSRKLETGGFWVAGSRASGEAIADAVELKPDVIIADMARSTPEDAVSISEELKRNPTLSDIPLLLLLSGGAAGSTADLVLTKPVTPRELLDHTRELLQQSRALRRKLDGLHARSQALIEKSTQLIGRAAQHLEEVDVTRRPCPGCGKLLEWVERGRIGGLTYDYYRWCLHGCGLYCFDRDHRQWVKLA